MESIYNDCPPLKSKTNHKVQQAQIVECSLSPSQSQSRSLLQLTAIERQQSSSTRIAKRALGQTSRDRAGPNANSKPQAGWINKTKSAREKKAAAMAMYVCAYTHTFVWIASLRSLPPLLSSRERTKTGGKEKKRKERERERKKNPKRNKA